LIINGIIDALDIQALMIRRYKNDFSKEVKAAEICQHEVVGALDEVIVTADSVAITL
jgi:hypothetical protein